MQVESINDAVDNAFKRYLWRYRHIVTFINVALLNILVVDDVSMFLNVVISNNDELQRSETLFYHIVRPCQMSF